MTYPSIKETAYHAPGPHRAVCVVPHGADAVDFLKFFPQLYADPRLRKVWPLFLSYLEVERDVGAGEIAHALAYHLAKDSGIPTLVVELNYPRGLLDGGRIRDHCLRECLPPSLMDALKDQVLAVHETSLAYVDRLYEIMERERYSYLIDVHTMASYCPVNALGERATFPVSFDTMQAYIDQYRHAHRYAFQRKIDLICSDAEGRKLADPFLLARIAESLEEAGYECLENEPYHAAPIYLSYQHMQKVPSISLDVPKHLVVKSHLQEDLLELDRLVIDPAGVRALARALASGITDAFAARFLPHSANALPKKVTS